MIDNQNNPPILSRLDDFERDDIITDEELEEIGVAYGSQERYEEAMRGLAGRLSGAKMGLRDDVSVGDGRKSPKIKAGESTVPVGTLPKIKRINITGKSILSADDAAQLFSAFRDPRIEIFNIAYVSKSKEVLAHTAWTCGLPTLVSNADGKTFEDGLSSIQTTMKQLGADKIWIAHNHPSGNPDPSIEDKRSTMAYASFLQDRFAGHIILDHDEYSIVFHNGTSMRLPLNEPVEDFETEKRRKASVISGSKDIASMFKKILSDSDEDTVVHAVLDNRNRVVSWAYGETNYTNEIKDYMRTSGGKTVITITNSESLFEEYCFKANNALNSKHDIFLDIVLVNRETGNLRLSHAKSESYFGGNWQLNEAKELKYVVKNFALQHEKKLSQAPNPPLSRGEAINARKERSMSDEFSELEDLSPQEQAFINALHQRKVVTEAMRNGTLSCMPGADGYADTQPALNIISGKVYHGTNLLYIKEHQKENGFPSGEYITAGMMDKARKDNPDLYIRKGQKGVSIYFSEKDEQSGEWENKSVRLFNVAQVSKPWELKEWVGQEQEKEQQKHIDYMRTQYGDKWQPPEPKQKEPGTDVVCTSTEPAKYLGQYLAAVSMGGKFKASDEQAAEFARNMEASMYEKVGVSPKTGEPVTDPFKLPKIGAEASHYCKEVLKDVRMEVQKQNQPEQKLEQQQSRGRSM